MRYPVIIIGGGQAGLSMSHCLHHAGIEHVVLESHRVAHAWRTQRWDTFCLVTPNWQCRLPGFPYAGDDPEGFMGKPKIVAYLEDYAASFAAPVHEGVRVLEVLPAEQRAGFELRTSDGAYSSSQLVVATGGYHVPRTPAMASALDGDVVQLHASTYRGPSQLPEGAVMVVGSGQSGCQIAEDLHLARRSVHLCVGSAPRVSRRYRGKDVVGWLERLGHYDLPIDQHPDGKAVRKKPNHYVTGRDGGRDIDLRKLALEGMRLHGRLTAITPSGFEFADDLATNLDRADATSDRIKDTIDAFIAKQAIDAPCEPRYQPLWRPTTAQRSLSHSEAKIRTVIWCMGFRQDFSWLKLPAFDADGYPDHERGITPVPGLYFLGLPWQYTWGSGRFCGVGRDAHHLSEAVAQYAFYRASFAT
jgi:putative flavoprotein involved in K+ transport